MSSKDPSERREQKAEASGQARIIQVGGDQHVHRGRGVGAAWLALTLATVVPAAALWRFTELRTSVPRAVLLVLAWVTLVAIVGFALLVFSDLSGRWRGRATNAFDTWLQRKISRFTRAHLRRVQAQTRYMDVKGLSTVAEYTLEMRDVLVTLALAPTPVHQLTADPIGRQPDHRDGDHEIWHWLRRSQREHAVLAIIGPPGSGKTTLLKHVAFVLARGDRVPGLPKKIPVLINLREQRSWFAEGARSLPELIRRSIGDTYPPREPPSWVESHLARGDLIILFDGLDEVPDWQTRASVTDWIEVQASARPGNLYVLTSRPFGYREHPVNGALVVETQPFSSDQIASFVRQWYRAITTRSFGADNESSRFAARTGALDLLARLNETPALFDLTANPLLLTMIANVHQYRNQLPGSRAELYEEICDVFLSKRHQARGVQVDSPARQKKPVLRVLAHRMMMDAVAEITVEDAGPVISPALSRLAGAVTPEAFLLSVEESSGLLVEKERGVYAFAHLTFQEFLAAEHIRDERRVGDLLSRLKSPWWQETIRLYAAIGDATPIVEACLVVPDDPALLTLAVQCTEDAQSLEQSVRDAVNRGILPDDARDNPASRAAAAQARLRLRLGTDLALRRNLFIGRPITWLEYQYFLDCLSGKGRYPDHWSREIYPEGHDDQPVIGVRHEDMLAFLHWLGSESTSGFRFREPRSDELEVILERTDPEGGRAYWSASQSMTSRDGRFWPLHRQPYQGLRHEPYPLSACQTFLPLLSTRVAADLAEAGTLPEVVKLLEAAGRAPAMCDAGSLLRDIQLAGDLVQAFERLPRDTPPPAVMPSTLESLKTLVTKLCRATEEALDRAVPTLRRTEAMSELRRTCRLSALRAAQACATIYHFETGTRELPPKHTMPRPSRRTPVPSRSPAVAMNVLAHAFVEIYFDLALLDARIDGSVPPVEGLIYSRDTDREDRSHRQSLLVEAGAARRLKGWERVKPWADRALAASALIVLSPIIALIVIAIKVDDKGPALFIQTRLGRYGESFRMLKFRTMIVDAEKIKHRSPNESAVLFKIKTDPRLTRVGARLRRLGLDELPQLFNIMRGEMSFIGPRPLLPEEDDRYTHLDKTRQLVKPGLTGLWQVSGRSDLPWDEAISLDLEYVEHCSLRLDLLIFLRTFSTILSGRGAY